MNTPFTHTICESGNGDIPSWMCFAICALPIVLLILDCLGA